MLISLRSIIVTFIIISIYFNMILLYEKIDTIVTMDYRTQDVEYKNKKLETCQIMLIDVYQKAGHHSFLKILENENLSVQYEANNCNSEELCIDNMSIRFIKKRK